MSLHNLAKHIQSQGRNGDSGLIHMTPGEIKGLQSLALTHGGSLTINPETGLPEASFLKWLIPALAIAAAPFTGGMSLAAEGAVVGGGVAAGMAAPSMLAATTALSSGLYAGGAGLATALGEGIMEKDLGKGLMAGLSAYGGLSTLGTLGTLGTAAATAAPVVGQQGANVVAQNALATDPSAIFNSATGQLQTAAQTALPTNPSAIFNSATNQLQPGAAQALATDQSAMLNSTTGQLYNPSYAPTAPPSWNAATFGTNFGNMSTWDKAKLAGGVALPLYNAMSDTGSTPKKPESTTTKYEGPYKPVPRTAQFQTSPTFYTDSSEHQYFNDVNPYPGSMPWPGTQAAQGGLMNLAVGDEGVGDEGQYSYAEGGEVAPQNPPLMSAPNLTAIQNYLSGIGAQPQTQPQLQQPGQGMDFSAIQNYIAGIGQQQPRQQIQIPQAPSIQPQVPIAQNQEYNYGFKPIEAIIPPPPPPKPKYNGGRSQNAKGGLTSLVDRSRFLEGPGTGLSDDIHTSIEGVQPARLADGEYVVSADVVSALGGGSSKAGAKKLKDMTGRVRQSAHGTKKQIKKINDRQVLPA